MQSVHPNAARLERWLGEAEVHNLSVNMRDWYGPPIAVAGVPGRVFVTGGGDFIGECRAGAEISGVERAITILKREDKRRFQKALNKQRGSFASLSALVTAATSGKSVRMQFSKTGTAPTAIAGAMDTWMYGPMPVAGAAGGAIATAPTICTNSTAGNLGYINAVVNANTGHFVNAWLMANFANSLLLVDQLYRGAITMTSTTAQTPLNTGTWSRYQDTTAGTADSASGTFAYPAVTGTVLAAVAHNWQNCTYENQGNAASNTMPTTAGISACAKNQIDLVLGSWFMPLASGDTGIYTVANKVVELSADVTSGTADWVCAHAIAVLPVPLVTLVCNIDGVASAFNLVNVYDNACLNLLELPKPATNATTYSGIITTVSE